MQPVQRAILLFLKWPEPGRVKTRLAAVLGADGAVKAYQRLVAEVYARLPENADLLVMFDPREREAEITTWIRELLPARNTTFFPQSTRDLGARLRHAFETAFARGYETVAAIGSDCVELTHAHFDEAWRELADADAVIGPTFDGGYYLIALKTSQPALFEAIDWSTAAVFDQTVERGAAAGLLLRELPTLHDVDTAEDWHRAQTQLGRSTRASEKNC